MAVSNKNLIDSYIQGFQRTDPELYQILRLMSQNFGELMDDLKAHIRATAPTVSTTLYPPPLQTFTCSLSTTGVTLSWTPLVIDASTYYSEIALYEIRKRNWVGAEPSDPEELWNAADRITKTAATSAFLSPIAVGDHTYYCRTIDRDGHECATFDLVNINVPALGSVTITSNCIDNNVLLWWTVPATTFRVDYYVISKDGSEYGKSGSTFATIFENSSNTYRYGIKAVDIAGNVGPEAFVDVEVKQPPDYTLVSVHDSTFSGTKNNCIVWNGQLWAIIDLVETWATHFTDNGFTKIKDQQDLGYDYYLQPNNLAGYYEEVVDFGSIFQNVIINLDWDFTEVDGNVIVAGQIEVSDDGAIWGAPIAGISAFATSCRYARVRLIFSSDDKSLIAISAFSISLDVKQETDSGNINALAADATGTQVNFNKAFKDVNSITLTVASIEPINAVYNFVDIPNPVGFKVLVFDTAGNRINYLVSWKARGVV